MNTASRIESHGAPSQIKVTGRARDRLAHAFRFEDCEPVEVKGKGTVIRCLMVGRSGDTASPVRPNGTPPLEPSTGP